MSVSRLAKAAIKIPKRIERGPTDILKALSQTVNFKPEYGHPKLLDDPYLLPPNGNRLRFYLLARENGVQAAKFMLNRHPELFYRDQAEPKVEAFAPPEKFEETMEFSEDDIKWCIENRDIENALAAYKSIINKGGKLSQEILLDFFEMICFTNEETLLSDTNDFSLVFYGLETINKDDEQIAGFWKADGIAQKIFQQFKNDEVDPSRSYSAMIAGLNKFRQFTTVYQLFEDFKLAYPDMGLYPEAYAALFKSVAQTMSSIELGYKAIEDIFEHMSVNNVKPNLLVFNSALDAYGVFHCTETTCKTALSLMNDMIDLNIQPSLATHKNTLKIFSKCRSRLRHEIIAEMLNDISSNIDSYAAIRDPSDIMFLLYAMNVFSQGFKNLAFCHRLHKITLKLPNHFSNISRKNIYFNNYFQLIVTVEPLDRILKFYNENKFNFSPFKETFDALADALELYQADQQTIDSIGKDIIQSRFANRITKGEIFRKNPAFVEAAEAELNGRQRVNRRNT